MSEEPRLADAVGPDEERAWHVLLREPPGVIDGGEWRVDRVRRTGIDERLQGAVEVLADARLEQRGGRIGLERGDRLFDDGLDVRGH